MPGGPQLQGRQARSLPRRVEVHGPRCWGPHHTFCGARALSPAGSIAQTPASAFSDTAVVGYGAVLAGCRRGDAPIPIAEAIRNLGDGNTLLTGAN